MARSEVRVLGGRAVMKVMLSYERRSVFDCLVISTACQRALGWKGVRCHRRAAPPPPRPRNHERIAEVLSSILCSVYSRRRGEDPVLWVWNGEGKKGAGMLIRRWMRAWSSCIINTYLQYSTTRAYLTVLRMYILSLLQRVVGSTQYFDCLTRSCMLQTRLDRHLGSGMHARNHTRRRAEASQSNGFRVAKLADVALRELFPGHCMYMPCQSLDGQLHNESDASCLHTLSALGIITLPPRGKELG